MKRNRVLTGLFVFTIFLSSISAFAGKEEEQRAKDLSDGNAFLAKGSYSKARDLLEKAAEAGSSEAMRALGGMAYNSQGW